MMSSASDHYMVFESVLIVWLILFAMQRSVFVDRLDMYRIGVYGAVCNWRKLQL